MARFFDPFDSIEQLLSTLCLARALSGDILLYELLFVGDKTLLIRIIAFLFQNFQALDFKIFGVISSIQLNSMVVQFPNLPRDSV